MLSLKPIVLAILIGALALVVSSQSNERKASGYLKKQGFDWVRQENEHFVLVAERGSFQEANFTVLAQRMEENRRRVTRLLAADKVSVKPFVFFLDSRTRMKLLTGNEVNGLADPNAGSLLMIYSPGTDAVTPHELFHLYARELWGTPGLEMLNEGMAVYAGDQWHGKSLHGVARVLSDKHKLIPISELISAFRKGDDLVTYPQAGSFAKFLSERYGPEKLKKAWRADGVKGFEKVFGRPMSQLETEWLATISSADASGIDYNASEMKR